MLNRILRTAFIILVLSLVTAAIVVIIGLTSKWQTEVQYSNGFFYGGGALLAIGLINAIGARTDDRVPGMADGRINTQERESSYQLLREDISKNNFRMVYLGVSGLLLWGGGGAHSAVLEVIKSDKPLIDLQRLFG